MNDLIELNNNDKNVLKFNFVQCIDCMSKKNENYDSTQFGKLLRTLNLHNNNQEICHSILNNSNECDFKVSNGGCNNKYKNNCNYNYKSDKQLQDTKGQSSKSQQKNKGKKKRRK